MTAVTHALPDGLAGEMIDRAFEYAVEMWTNTRDVLTTRYHLWVPDEFLFVSTSNLHTALYGLGLGLCCAAAEKIALAENERAILLTPGTERERERFFNENRASALLGITSRSKHTRDWGFTKHLNVFVTMEQFRGMTLCIVEDELATRQPNPFLSSFVQGMRLLN